jgi:hypothetical protein
MRLWLGFHCVRDASLAREANTTCPAQLARLGTCTWHSPLAPCSVAGRSIAASTFNSLCALGWFSGFIIGKGRDWARITFLVLFIAGIPLGGQPLLQWMAPLPTPVSKTFFRLVQADKDGEAIHLTRNAAGDPHRHDTDSPPAQHLSQSGARDRRSSVSNSMAVLQFAARQYPKLLALVGGVGICTAKPQN